jgi:hypothetical protein
MIGMLREEFFVQHIKNSGNEISYIRGGRKNPDFKVNNIIIEIGGKNKSRSQRAEYYALQTTEMEERTIPLYLFGFLY